MNTGQVNVRYMVEHVDAAIEFYTKQLGFKLGTNSSPAFADVTRGNLRLLLSLDRIIRAKALTDIYVKGRLTNFAYSFNKWEKIEKILQTFLN